MDKDAIEEIFAALGPVTIRRMFGGQGIYHGGIIIALVIRGDLLFKADAVTSARFAAAGARQWTYAGRNGKTVAMPYWTVPEAAYDDPDEMAAWARMAHEAALRASAGSLPREA